MSDPSRLSVTLPLDLAARLEAAAQAHGCSRQELVRAALEQYLAQPEEAAAIARAFAEQRKV
jgi:metal-responsive CopG/Arc/MetJ family transcriptional regulator